MSPSTRRAIVFAHMAVRAILWAVCTYYTGRLLIEAGRILYYLDEFVDTIAMCAGKDVVCYMAVFYSLHITPVMLYLYVAFFLRWIVESCIPQGFANYSKSLEKNTPPLDAAKVRFNDDTTHTVFFPGNGGDLTQIARYVGPKGFRLYDNGGTHVYHRDAAELFPNPWLGGLKADGSDVEPHGVVRYYPYNSSHLLSVVTTPEMRGFVTGVQGGYPVEHRFTEYNIGQESDVLQGLRVLRAAMEEHSSPSDRFVLFGTSRGAAVALQVTARLTTEEVKRVRFVILEGVFTNVPQVLTYRFGELLGSIVHGALELVTQYRTISPSPYYTALNFPHKNLPIGVVTSRKDDIVDPNMGKTIHKALCSLGVDARLLELNASSHSGYSTEDERDRAAYVAFMQDFYNKH